MQLGEVAHYGKPQPRAPVAAVGRLPGLLVQLEDLAQLLGRDAHAVVGDAHDDPAGGGIRAIGGIGVRLFALTVGVGFPVLEPNRQAYEPATVSVLDGVVHQVLQNAPQLLPVGHAQGHIWRHRAGESHVLAFRDRGQRLAHELGQIDEVHRLGQKLVLLGGVLGNDEDVVHHVQQKGGIRLDFAHGLAGLGC